MSPPVRLLSDGPKRMVKQELLPSREDMMCLSSGFQLLNMATESKYNKRGVSSTKEDVHAAIKNIDKGLYPDAFCKIVPDHLGGDQNFCNIMHSDGAGTKSSLAYISVSYTHLTLPTNRE